MNHYFPRLLTLLRKERKLSQKEAAKELGISQALLSHYENGIRECGLDFLVRAAEYYQVSCDYLLGRTASRSGAALQQESEQSDSSKEASVLFRSMEVIMKMIEKFNCRDLSASVLSYLKTATYQVFRLLYSANLKNTQSLFHVSKDFYRNGNESSLLLLENRIDLLARGKNVPGFTGAVRGGAPEFSIDKMEQETPASADALQTLILDVEQQ